MPTKSELWMWRISSLLLCGLPLVVLLVYAIVVKYSLFDDDPPDSPAPLGNRLAVCCFYRFRFIFHCSTYHFH